MAWSGRPLPQSAPLTTVHLGSGKGGVGNMVGGDEMIVIVTVVVAVMLVVMKAAVVVMWWHLRLNPIARATPPPRHQ